MTEPLINRDDLIAVVQDVIGPGGCEPIADAVLDRLRSVLTSEALDPREVGSEGFVRSTYWADGADLHRRIFGEDT